MQGGFIYLKLEEGVQSYPHGTSYDFIKKCDKPIWAEVSGYECFLAMYGRESVEPFTFYGGFAVAGQTVLVQFKPEEINVTVGVA